MQKRIDSLQHGVAVALVAALLVSACDSREPPAAGPPAPANVAAAAPETAAASAGPAEAPEVTVQRAVVSERLPYAEVGDRLVYGHFVFPSDMLEPLPAVIVIHEWWGLDETVKAMSDRLAAEGYIVLAVDLFDGKVTAAPEIARQMMLRVLERPETAEENIRQAFDFVNSVAGAPRVATLGWDFGGGWSLNAAMLFPEELDASVIYYGQVTSDTDRLSGVKAPVLGLFGGRDSVISEQSVRGFEDALNELGVRNEIHVFPAAGHAFANPAARNYDAAVAEDAWQKTLQFLNRNLYVAASDG